MNFDPSGPHSQLNVAPQLEGDAPIKKKRRKVNHACLYCRRSHMTCDDGRPCQRCIKRDIGHLCRDEPKAPAPPKNAPAGSTVPSQGSIAQPTSLTSAYPFTVPPGSSVLPGNQQTTSISPTAGPRTSSGHNQWPLPAQGSHQNWGSESIGNEFSALTDFLEVLNDNSFFGAPQNGPGPMNVEQGPPPHGSNQPMVTQGYVGQGQEPALHHQTQYQHHPQQHEQPLHQQQSQPAPGPYSQPQANVRPPPPDASFELSNAVSKTEQFFMTAADQAGGTRDERLAKVIHAKYEAGLLKPYNYVNGYKRLSLWMERNVSPHSRQAIQHPLAMLRPKFRVRAAQLADLVFIEEAFERLLLDYDRVFSAMGIPACLWRRTGEIYKGNREFANLIGVNVTDLVDGKLAIYELMSEESAVNFWEKYGHVAFDTGQKAVLTSCVLRYKPREVVYQGHPQQNNAPLQERFVNCCFSFTIRRDSWGIPVAIIGNFISY
ncbi:hypothetical protein CPB86DRAFT_774857 [Serendipita vermifera]|nr:hypothetical protein CPB86DRAFT_774857 [Serendipita vermifera]